MACGNTNFSFRTHCNMRKCGEPRPDAPPLPPRAPLSSQGMGGPKSMGPPGNKGGAGDAPEGSWECAACRNVNYPFRTHCNRRNCGVKRGETAAPNGGGDATHGEGNGSS